MYGDCLIGENFVSLFGLLASLALYLIESHRLSEWLELLNWNEIRALAILIVNTLSLYGCTCGLGLLLMCEIMVAPFRKWQCCSIVVDHDSQLYPSRDLLSIKVDAFVCGF